jgi:hypothetical protein
MALVERLERGLPVAREHQPLPPAVTHFLELVLVEIGRDGFEIVAQRLAIGVHVDPHPAAPAVALHRGKPRVLVIEAIAIALAVVDEGDLAADLPAPAMELADELPDMAAALGQLAAAMLAL